MSLRFEGRTDPAAGGIAAERTPLVEPADALEAPLAEDAPAVFFPDAVPPPPAAPAFARPAPPLARGPARAPSPASPAPARAGSGAGPSCGASLGSVPRPRYPDRCRGLGHEGRAVLLVDVGPDGAVTAVALERSAGCPELDAAAIEAVRAARFEPARRFGEAVASRVRVPIRFELRD